MNTKIKIFFTLILFFVIGSNLCIANNDPKERTIIFSGKIIDANHNELLAGVSITATNCEKTIYSDLNGNFFIYIKLKDDKEFKLEFTQVGYNTKTLTLADLSGQTSNLEVNLIEE
jgi:hypothetical protein